MRPTDFQDLLETQREPKCIRQTARNQDTAPHESGAELQLLGRL